jgi:hypothetical protein
MNRRWHRWHSAIQESCAICAIHSNRQIRQATRASISPGTRSRRIATGYGYGEFYEITPTAQLDEMLAARDAQRIFE